MPDDTFHEIRLIRSRLEAIEHTQEVLVRADASAIWGGIEAALNREPILADVFLLVDGKRTQVEIVAALKAAGAPVASEPTVSRALRRLREDLQIIAVVADGGRGNVYARTRLDRILGLQRRIETWKRKREDGTRRS